MDYIKAGDKVTMIKNKNTSYRTDIYDVNDNVLTINTPMDKEGIIVCPKGNKYNFVFSTNTGRLYIAAGSVEKQYHDRGFALTDIDLLTPLKKYQRRQYYRLKCTLRARGIGIKDGQDPALVKRAERFLTKDEGMITKGIILNISGGGAYMVCDHDFGDAEWVLLNTTIMTGHAPVRTPKKIELLANILEKKQEGNRFFYRLFFIFDDDDDREEIIKYVFNEQLEMRRQAL